jgi:hypothetical protein
MSEPAKNRTWKGLMIGACAIAFAAVLSVTAIVMRARGVEPPPAPAIEPVAPLPAPERLDFFKDVEDGACRPPGSAIAAIVAADAAYDAGDFARARELYLDVLLSGGDCGDGIARWAHGRLALAMARLAHDQSPPLVDEPALEFREGGK